MDGGGLSYTATVCHSPLILQKMGAGKDPGCPDALEGSPGPTGEDEVKSDDS